MERSRQSAKAEGRRRKPLPNALRRRIAWSDQTAVWLRHAGLAPITPANRTGIDTGEAEFHSWLEDRRGAVLDGLLRYYRIGRNAPDKWRRLAYGLAFDYVPAMQLARRPGRRRDGRGFIVPMASRGAPRKWFVDEYKGIAALVLRGQRALRRRGVRVSVTAALVEGIRERPITQGWSNHKIRREARKLAKRFSDLPKPLRETIKRAGRTG